MEEDLLETVPSIKLYAEISVRVGTFIGGPLVAGYLIAENFKLLGQNDKVKPTWIYAIIATIIVFGGAFLLQGSEKVPNYFIPIIYTLTASYLVKHFQGNQIKRHTDSGGQMYSVWRAVLAGLIGLVITVGIIFIILLLTSRNLLQR